jgi:hypothetical protein
VIQFHQATSVAPGDNITSGERNLLATAFIDRLRSGLGSPTERIHYLALAATRWMICSDLPGFQYVPEGLVLQDYILLPPTEGTWPVADPGEVGGPSAAHGLVSFIHGNTVTCYTSPGTLEAEAVRLPPAVTALAAGDIWEAAKSQRGVMDPTTGEADAPALRAALEHQYITYSARSLADNSYGGFQPQPEYLGDCDDGMDPPAPNHQLIYRRLDDTQTVTYETCGLLDENAWAWVTLPLEFWVFVTDSGAPGGSRIDKFPRNLWQEGPYSGAGRLQKGVPGGQLDRFLWAFAAEFRGDAAQRAAPNYDAREGFDFETVLTRPNYLAPALGVASGPENARVIDAFYPTYQTTSSVPAGTWLGLTNASGQTVSVPAGFHATGILVRGEAGASGRVGVYAGSTRVSEVNVTPDEAGAFADVVMWPQGHTENLAVKAETALSANGIVAQITVEILVQYNLPVELRDIACVMLRLASGTSE